MKKDKIRVVAYARVSTAKNDQKNSFENQQSYFLDILSKNKDLILVSLPTNTTGIYADRGISGTKLVRPEFDKMLQDAGLKRITSEETGKKTDKYEIVGKPLFDRIYVKDTKRFARNTSADDLLKTLRQNGVIVHFLDLNKTTEDLNDITVIQLFLALGESDSLRLSTAVKFGYEEGARKGNIYYGGKIIGYDYIKKDPNRPYETNILKKNKDAELVQLIFDMYTEQGLGHQRICNELYKMGYKNSTGKKYTRSTISRILENEKYCGVNTAGRYSWGDVINKKLKENDYNSELRTKAREATQRLADEGIVTRIEPIISKEQFEKARQIRESNRKKYSNDCTYHGITDYARKIKCDCCGAWYTAQSRKYTARIKCENCGTWHIEQLEKNERTVNCNKCGVSYIVPSRDKMKDKCNITRYYACSHRVSYSEKDGIKKCNNPSIREDKLDEILNSDLYYKERLDNIDEVIGAGEICIEVLKEAINTDNEAKAAEVYADIERLKAERDKLIPLYAKGIYSESELESTTNNYNNQIAELTMRYNQLSKSNTEIRADIEQIKELMADAEKEENELINGFQSGKYPKRSRKEQLKDIEYISIDMFGEASIIFKSINDIQKVIDYVDSIRYSYDSE